MYQRSFFEYNGCTVIRSTNIYTCDQTVEGIMFVWTNIIMIYDNDSLIITASVFLPMLHLTGMGTDFQRYSQNLKDGLQKSLKSANWEKTPCLRVNVRYAINT